ncbi:MAG: ATP-binding protein, partial [Candidatus Thermoplasmatota archaeon]
MKKLLKKNYVVERRGHVTGFKRMVKVYSLTWEGKIEAERLIKLMENEVITLIDENGSYNKLKIGEVLKKTSISITEIIKYSKEDVFDMRVFHKKVSEVKEEEKRHFYELPKIGQFFNRDRELKMLKEFVDAGLPKFIIVYGIPGIGKTTLISKFLSGYNTNVFYYRIHQLESVRSLLSAVSGFLSRIGKQKLSSYLSKEINIDLHKVLSIFEEEINEMNII